ncbi:hypothetical protein ACP275_04G170100 [Erythranthe tilingii]
MATKMIIALIFSIFFISQVSSDSKNSEETTTHVFNRGGESKLIHQAPASAPAPALNPAPNPNGDVDCDGQCKKRCSLHSRQNVCLRACGTCCVRCKCVPPGTFGNREICGKCYTDMTTHGNRTKCP